MIDSIVTSTVMIISIYALVALEFADEMEIRYGCKSWQYVLTCVFLLSFFTVLMYVIYKAASPYITIVDIF